MVNPLDDMSRKIMGTSLLFDRQRQKLNEELRRIIRKSMRGEQVTQLTDKVSPFHSAWLPGPLSYPWTLMLLSISVIMHLVSSLSSLAA